LNVGEQEYVLLLDFNKLNIGVAEVEIVASDDAGNTARTFHVMRFTAIELVVS
jgi:hypothetical protein